MKQFTVTLTLDEGQQRKLDEFAALRRKCELVPRPGNCYTHEATLQCILSIASFDAIVEDASAWERELLSNRKETVSEFWEVELPEDDEAEPDEPETVSNGEEEAPSPVSADVDMEKKKVDITFSITEGNMIHDALSEAGAERALVRRFPHTWLFPVEDESLYNAVWEGDTSMSLDTEECRTIANALFARSFSQRDKGYETISDELSDLAWKINRAAYPVRMANLAASAARSEAKKEAGYLPARNPSPEEATPPQLIEDRTDEYFNYLEHGTMPEESHETLIPVIDADGVQRMATLDEVEEMREAAQGIYNGAPPEPKEPEDSFRDKGYLYDPAHYEGDAYECGSIVVSAPESLAFADALLEALYR